MVSSIVRGSFHLLSSAGRCLSVNDICLVFGGGVQDAREDALRRAALGSARVCAGKKCSYQTFGLALNLFHVVDRVTMDNAQDQ